MKKLLFAFAALAMISCNNEKSTEGNLHIKGNIKGLKQGTLYVQKIGDSGLVAIDTIVVKGDSKFESHLTIDSPEMLYLILEINGTKYSLDNIYEMIMGSAAWKENDAITMKVKRDGKELTLKGTVKLPYEEVKGWQATDASKAKLREAWLKG